MKKYIILFLFFASCSSVGVDIINYGEIKANPPVGKVVESGSHTGYLHIMSSHESPVFLQVDTIKAKLGKRFGINVLVRGGKFGEIAHLVTRVVHPPFKNGQTVDQWDSPLNFGVTRYTGWVFENQEELVAGDWTFEITDQDGKVLATKKFIVSVE